MQWGREERRDTRVLRRALKKKGGSSYFLSEDQPPSEKKGHGNAREEKPSKRERNRGLRVLSTCPHFSVKMRGESNHWGSTGLHGGARTREGALGVRKKRTVDSQVRVSLRGRGERTPPVGNVWD